MLDLPAVVFLSLSDLWSSSGVIWISERFIPLKEAVSACFARDFTWISHFFWGVVP